MRARRLAALGIAACLAALTGCSSGSNGARPKDSAQSESPNAVTPSPSPTAAALPVLSGTYKAVGVVKTSDTKNQPAGTNLNRTWRFTPLCADPTCDVKLEREAAYYSADGKPGTKFFPSTATRTATGYRGVERKPVQCIDEKGHVTTGPGQSTFTYTITVTANPNGRPTFTATSSTSAPAAAGCPALHQTATYTGTPA